MIELSRRRLEEIADECWHKNRDDYCVPAMQQALAEQRELNGWVKIVERLPDFDEQVLVRGWGEGKKHYLYKLVELTPHGFMQDDGESLWFTPHEWKPLSQQPEESA